MNYTSTRDNSLSVSSAQAIKNGISKDGGLFVPCDIPVIDEEFIKSLTTLTYKQRAKKVLGLFLTDYTSEELDECTNGAYSTEKFGSEDSAPVYKLADGAYILELWHGPSCAFKDMALQILPHLLTKAIKKTGEDKTVVILVATSGDTGKAALEGFKDVNGTKIQVFYPVDGVSKIQKLQMATQLGDNVCVEAVYGNFDDAQTGVKKIFTNADYAKELADKGYVLSSANSINWGRLAPQIVYYFSAYADLLNKNEIKYGDKINIVVPTGNFGNILAAFYAKLMGLPVNKLICASNKNNVLTEFLKTGTYDKNRSFFTTSSPSMDILISSNLERLLYHISGNDASKTAEYMSLLNTEGKYTVSDDIKKVIDDNFAGGFCDDKQTKETIKETFDKYSYTLDTHTAVAVKVYNDYVEKTGDNTPTVIASTANPYKFNASVIDAISGDGASDGKDEFELLDMLNNISGLEIPASLANLKSMDVRFTDVCEKENMIDKTSEFLK